MLASAFDGPDYARFVLSCCGCNPMNPALRIDTVIVGVLNAYKIVLVQLPFFIVSVQLG